MKIGIDLGGSHIGIGVVNNKGKILEKVEKRITNLEKKNIRESIETYVIENVNQFVKKYEVTGIGMAIPGTLNSGKIVKSVNLGIKEEYDISKIITKKTKLPVTIKNDAKCAALAENKFGSLQEAKRVIFLTLGTGIGGAVIIDNKLLDTGDLPGCEFGHMTIHKDGKQCKCGKKGCFEAYGSMKAFKTNLRDVLGLDEKTRGEELLAMIRNLKKSDKNYKKINGVVDEFITYLAIGISNLVNIFEPEEVGIGGSFVYFQDVILERLKDKIKEENLLFNARKELKIVPAVLGNDAGIIGSTLIF